MRHKPIRPPPPLALPCPQYRPDVKVAGTTCEWFPRNLNATLCTHVNYAFASLNEHNGSERQGRQLHSAGGQAAVIGSIELELRPAQQRCLCCTRAKFARQAGACSRRPRQFKSSARWATVDVDVDALSHCPHSSGYTLGYIAGNDVSQLYPETMALRQQNPDVKILVAVGKWCVTPPPPPPPPPLGCCAVVAAHSYRSCRFPVSLPTLLAMLLPPLVVLLM